MNGCLDVYMYYLTLFTYLFIYVFCVYVPCTSPEEYSTWCLSQFHTQPPRAPQDLASHWSQVTPFAAQRVWETQGEVTGHPVEAA